MTQTPTEKAAAIISLLELVWFHLDYIPGAMRVQRYGEAEGGEGTPPLAPVNVNCNGRCHTCLAYYRLMGKKPVCPPEEKWARERATLRRRYRIADVEESLMRLATVDATLAQAVWAEHVESWPDPRTEPIAADVREYRRECARRGVEWMAHDVRGDVPAYGERPDPIENQIRQLAAQGYTQRRIQRELRCDRNKITAVLCGQDVRRE